MSKRSGFTLIELLVVISIIGILAGLLLTNFVGVRERAADTAAKNDVNQLKKALRLYYNDNQEYPEVADVPSSGAFESSSGTVYMKEVPTEFEYTVSADGEEFVVKTELQNVSDEDIADSQTRCDVANRSYAGTIETTTYVVCED